MCWEAVTFGAINAYNYQLKAENEKHEREMLAKMTPEQQQQWLAYEQLKLRREEVEAAKQAAEAAERASHKTPIVTTSGSSSSSGSFGLGFASGILFDELMK